MAIPVADDETPVDVEMVILETLVTVEVKTDVETELADTDEVELLATTTDELGLEWDTAPALDETLGVELLDMVTGVLEELALEYDDALALDEILTVELLDPTTGMVYELGLECDDILALEETLVVELLDTATGVLEDTALALDEELEAALDVTEPIVTVLEWVW